MSKNFEDLQRLYEQSQSRVLESEQVLAEDEEAMLRQTLEDIEGEIDRCEKLRAKLGRVLDYNKLKKQGFSAAQVRDFAEEDSEYITKVDSYYARNLQRRKYMFGYPANMEDYSYTTSYLRHLESKMYLMNNCGDPYQKGNYGMDSKSTEKKIISLVADNFGISPGEYWGYITSGGTESNFWGIREGFNRFPNGKLYFSKDTHYSVEKYVFDGENRERYPYEIIDVDAYGRMSPERLFEAVENDRKNGVEGVILVLTWGTTCRGAVDEVQKITQGLRARGIEYYCHLDAAHFGGISQNQEDAPKVDNLATLGVDSLAISMHKFMGTARVNGVLLALTRRDRPVIDYIGQEDSTLLGSRDYLPFSTYQRAREMLLRRGNHHYISNVCYFENGMKLAGLSYERFENSNTFVIHKPCDKICKKYQLATFLDSDGMEKAHIIIFPFHEKEIMDELIGDLLGLTANHLI
ncbi:MAG: hypothetical protein E7645_03895 [Ruminococcaceae bacterium]|nr:hypothetical protein [Oscillospiraceae bacterium]